MARKKDNETPAEEQAPVEETTAEVESPEAEVPEASAEQAEAAAEAVDAAAEADEPVEALIPEPAEEAPAADEVEAEAEPAAAEAATEPEPATEPEAAEPAAEAETEAEADAEPEAEPESEAETAPTAAEPKRKKKRLPRALRRQRTRRTREPSTTRKSIVRLEKPEHDRGRRQERQGTVVSDAMDKTIVVRVDTISAHPRYKKVVRRSRKFHAHDERNEAKVGDVVRIVETRPLSALKRWRLTEIVEQAK
jgi:small subunit ribosomal protein S17